MSVRFAVCLLVLFASPTQLLIAAETLPAPIEEIRQQLGKSDLDAAIDAAEEAEEQLPDDARTWFWSGRAYARQAMEANVLTKLSWASKSREAYEKSVALAPNLHEARFDLMQYYLVAPGIAGGDRQKADAQVAELVRRDLVWGKLAESSIAWADKKPEAAEAVLREAVAAVPDSQLARITLSRTLQRQNRWKESKSLWLERLSVPTETAISRYQIGRAAAMSGEELDEGLAMLDAFLAAGDVPENMALSAAHWRRGQVLDKLGKREEAIAALTLAGNDPTISKEVAADLDRIRKALK